MKKILLTLLLITLSLSVFSQDKPSSTDKFKDYKACADCMEQWQNSNTGSPTSPRTQSQSNGLDQNGNVVKTESKRLFARILSITSGVILVGYLAKVNSVTTQD